MTEFSGQTQTTYLDPNTNEMLPYFEIRPDTLQMLEFYKFEDNTGTAIQWTNGQLQIIDCILHRSSPNGLKRIQIIAATQYGKSLAVAAGIAIRASLKPEKWAIVAGTQAKAEIIMEYVIMLCLNNDVIKTQLQVEESLDRLRMRKSAERLSFKRKGEIRVYSAEAKRVTETSKSLMGFGAPNVIEDESGLIPDMLQATVMRMVGGTIDNFLIKIGNPFTRGHFLRTWIEGKYFRIFIDYHRALLEGRFSQDFIDEMMNEAMFDVLYACLFPASGVIDVHGWMPLLTEEELERAYGEAIEPFGNFRLGNDVAGGGRNFSTIVLRAYNVARKLYKEREPDTMKFIEQINTLGQQLGVSREDYFIDSVGVGKGAYDRARQLNDKFIGVSGGQTPFDSTRFVNLRAEMYWRLREWIIQGGRLEKDPDWKQLLDIKYRVQSGSAKIVIMSKEEMLKNGIDSPDVADALAMTFAKLDTSAPEQTSNSHQAAVPNPDPY